MKPLSPGRRKIGRSSAVLFAVPLRRPAAISRRTVRVAIRRLPRARILVRAILLAALAVFIAGRTRCARRMGGALRVGMSGLKTTSARCSGILPALCCLGRVESLWTGANVSLRQGRLRRKPYREHNC